LISVPKTRIGSWSSTRGSRRLAMDKFRVASGAESN